MPDNWTGKLVGEMHNAKISQSDLAREMGVDRAYVSMILSSLRTPPNAEERLRKAFEAVKAKRNA